MRMMIAVFIIFICHSLNANTINNDLLADALSGDKEARFKLAEMFNDPNHEFYYPKKAIDLYLSLAREGHPEAFTPLSEHFSSPDSPFYDPARAIMYLRHIENVSPGFLLLNEVLAYRIPMSRIKSELKGRNIPTSDQYYRLLSALSYFPFESASNTQREALLNVVNDDVAAPFLAYIYPALILPIVGQHHLLSVAKAELMGERLPPMLWYQDDNTNYWFPVTETSGVNQIKFIWEPDQWRGKRLGGIKVFYPPEANTALQAYYSDFMHPCKDGWCLPGIFLRFRVFNDSVLSEFIFTPITPLMKPAAKPVGDNTKHQFPRLLYSDVPENKKERDGD